MTRKANEISKETTRSRADRSSTVTKILKNMLDVHCSGRYEHHRGKDTLEVQMFHMTRQDLKGDRNCL